MIDNVKPPSQESPPEVEPHTPTDEELKAAIANDEDSLKFKENDGWKVVHDINVDLSVS
jgi:hypothetical protein